MIDIDATRTTAHSEKEGAAGNFEKGFGHHPLLCYLDDTGEALAGILRPGNAGSNMPYTRAGCNWGSVAMADSDGITVPCSYRQIGEIDENVQGLRSAQGINPPFDLAQDSAPEFYLRNQPSATDPTVRATAPTSRWKASWPTSPTSATPSARR